MGGGPGHTELWLRAILLPAYHLGTSSGPEPHGVLAAVSLR